MRIETTGLLYPAPLGAPLTPQTPPPSTDGPAAMDGDIRPAVDALPLRGRREYAQLCLLRDDFAACLAVVNGMELGVFIRRARLFAFYGQRAPRLEVRPLRLDGSVRLAEAIPSVLPHQNTALLLSAVTFPDTPPGIYRTNLEVEGEAGVTYLPVAVEVAGVTAPPVETRTGPALTDPLDILFSAAGDGPFLLPEAEGYTGVLYRAALADRRLFAAARTADPLLTDTLLASLRAVRTHCEDDADLLRKIRRTLVHRLDGRFAAGNREPLYAPGDKPA